MEYAAQNKLFQNSPSNYLSEFDRVVVSNGKCTKSFSALLHWKTLFTLGKHAGCIDQLQKVTKHNYELNITFPAANFIDSHFHLDKLTQRSSIKSLDRIMLSCRQYSSNINKYVLEFAIANYCFPRSWSSNVDLRKITNEESKEYFTVVYIPDVVPLFRRMIW